MKCWYTKSVECYYTGVGLPNCLDCGKYKTEKKGDDKEDE